MSTAWTCEASTSANPPIPGNHSFAVGAATLRMPASEASTLWRNLLTRRGVKSHVSTQSRGHATHAHFFYRVPARHSAAFQVHLVRWPRRGRIRNLKTAAAKCRSQAQTEAPPRGMDQTGLRATTKSEPTGPQLT